MKITGLSVFLLILFLSFGADANTKGEAKPENKKDTLSGSIATSAATVYDSTSLIPAYSLYKQWDTNNIHPYKYQYKSINDTSYLPLIDEFNCGYHSPFEGDITSNFGMRRGRPHYGVDIDLETGDSVFAAFSGKVRIARRNRTYGNLVVIRHPNGLETYYAHLSEIIVDANDNVVPGQVIGLGGNTGRSYGSHLHFEVRYKGMPLNPNDLISFDECSLKDETFPINKKSFAFLAEVKRRKYHTIRRGDTLYGLSRRYGTSVRRLCKLNGISSKTVLRIGRRLRYN